MLPYGRQSIDASDIAAVTDALNSDWLTTGPEVERFETAVAARAGVDHAVSVTSGTAALHVAYAAAGIEPGDEVITTPLTFVATAATAALLGAKIVFADVDPATGNLDPSAVEAAVTERTRVVAGVDYAGVPVDAPALRGITSRHDLLLLEDAAHSIGSTLDGAPVGSLADLTTYSFFPTKNLTTTEGGAVVTADAELAARAVSFKNHGLVRDRAMQRYPDEGPWHQEVHAFGLNYRLPDVLCALGTSQLERLDQFVARRAEIKAAYDEALGDLEGVDIPVAPQGAAPAWHLYPLRVPAERRRSIFDSLREQGIGVQVNYIPAYWHPVFEDLGYQRGMCPVAEEYYRREISLPMFPALTDSDVERVIEATRVAVAG
ncbi:UDP-4-amino-4,6-dideoxy-N-acetyl-beta-L-altrosamine transaminase [Brachybacterium muris]|uniref:UDP-4-amino-4, 6-dideoxy-N-acetyl-beta-L-altrosamine transaminase n=1 Tax=Brachybacterium muris TaxID=219301 RepID=UPI00195DE433|nr:UDP-4-amino-4,6-dideoxy-N-acetyl-beta-L-altrosamine transaminase [Brachybacterium muris]MCT2261052.1 UDP-4-amino-4,6-dideoxy-N-acetyl-beta-L-altrosamine transaminase [Brachybacterium muris]MCT2295334.1 UDP-4-amino-4,6-dideoxy-N-acetyl-beta-L-altrosamine transaminase [Brachybacterium muris]